MARARSLVLAMLVVFASANTLVLAYSLAYPPALSVIDGRPVSPNGSPLQAAVSVLEAPSRVLAPLGWTMVLGLWAWKGKTRSEWSGLGLQYDSFRLFARMRGGPTRVRLLRSLEMPKDRLQLAKDLGLDWKTVDAHVRKLLKEGAVQERMAYGNVKVYELTSTGALILRLMEPKGEEEMGKPIDRPTAPSKAEETPKLVHPTSRFG